VNRTHAMPFGAQLDAQGRTRFRLWAPSAKSVALKVQPARGKLAHLQMTHAGEGWYEVTVPEAGAGTRYIYRIDDELDVPDPASRFNPQGVHAQSVVVDPSVFRWRDEVWKGHAWHELVIYELHVGTFTREGTYTAMIPLLDDLAALGITTLELLPLASFGGKRGWGYDGVLQYAPHPAYGNADELKTLIQSAHQRGLSVLIDVVYNHFGPDGNYLGRFAQEFFTSKHHTPWGDAIDFSNPVVRQFFIHNALYWIDEYHVDGLRIDAVHAMYDDTKQHFIDELIDTVQNGPGRTRNIHIVLENERNEARRLTRPAVSQWNDDFHHAVHVLLTGESESYYEDYAERPLSHLGRTLTQGFSYQGERSLRSGEHRGEPSGHLPPSAFVNFLQNHDQIGNRACGERLVSLADPQSLRAALSVLLLGPQLPMLFMGEEYGASQPFFYFCDYEGELAAAVREGRRNEFSGFAAFSDEKLREKIPDPNAVTTFQKSQLSWEERTQDAHQQWWDYVRALLQLRARRIVPLVPELEVGESSYSIQGDALRVCWRSKRGTDLLLFANLSVAASAISDLPGEDDRVFVTPGDGHGSSRTELAPWEVRVFISGAGA
jgi:maltooligosyltrehalose trehalohydrolase